MEINLEKLPDQKYYSMKEAVEICSLKSHTLRYWEKAFEELFQVKRISNRRMYEKKDLMMFLKIKDLSSKGMNLKAIKRKFRDGEIEINLDLEVLDSLKEVLKILKT